MKPKHSASKQLDEHAVTLDVDRSTRCGFPEVIFGEGKSPEALVAIAGELLNGGQPVLATRVTNEHATALAAMDQLRSEKEKLTATMAEVAEKLRSQESQTQFLEQARTDLLTQFRSLSGQMLDGSREALLKSTKETVSEPFAKEVLQCPTNAGHRGCRPACGTDLRGSAELRHAPCSPAERESLQWRPGRGGIGPTADAQR